MSTTDQVDIESRVEAALYGSDEPIQPVEASAEVVEQPLEVDEAEQVEAPAQNDDEVAEYQTIEDLAAALEISPEDFLSNTRIMTKVFDDEREVSLADLQAGYQKGEAFDEKKAELSKSKAALNQERLEQAHAVQQQAEQLKQMGDMYAQVLLGEYGQVNWERLRDENPEVFAQQYPAYQQRLQQIQGIQQQANQLQQLAWTQRQPYENAALLNAIPEWTEPETAERGKAEIIQLLQEEGADQGFFNAVQQNHMAIKLLNELVTLRKQAAEQRLQPKESASMTKKSVKVLKSGPRKTQSEKTRSRADQLKARLKKTGNSADLQAVLLERM